MFAEGNLIRGQELLNTFLPRADSRPLDELRGFDWYYLWKLNHQEKATFKGHGSFVNAVAFAPDGKTLASGS